MYDVWNGQYAFIAVFTILLLIASLTFFWGLGSLPLLGPDEPRYSEVGREMFATGDYITPRLCGHLWFEKPVLLYWLMACAYRLFGVNEFAARFPSAMAATATVLFLCWALWSQGKRKWAVGAAFVLATSALWLGMARGASTDMVLATTMGAAILSGYLSMTAAGLQRWIYWLFCAGATGLSMLAKGLVGVLLVALILGLWVCATRRLCLRTIILNWPFWISGAIIFVLVSATWYVPVTMQHGRTFIEEFFINHHFKRYLADKYHHNQPFYFYLFVMIVGCLPWSFFLLPAVARLRSLLSVPNFTERRFSSGDSILVLAWIWIAIPVLFFSVSTSKLPSYILPILPALGIVIGAEIERLWNGERSGTQQAAAGLSVLLLIGIGTAFFLYLYKKSAMFDHVWWLSAFAPGVVGCLSAYALLRGRPRFSLAGITVFMMTLILSTVSLLFPHVYDSISVKSLSVQIDSSIKPGERIAFYRQERVYSPVFYNEGRIIFYENGALLEGIAKGDKLDANSIDDLILALNRELSQGDASMLVITPTARLTELEKDPRIAIALIGSDEKLSAFRISPRVPRLF